MQQVALKKQELALVLGPPQRRLEPGRFLLPSFVFGRRTRLKRFDLGSEIRRGMFVLPGGGFQGRSRLVDRLLPPFALSLPRSRLLLAFAIAALFQTTPHL